jgi:hypothetical protein
MKLLLLLIYPPLLLFAFSNQAFSAVDGDWTYFVKDGEATITAYTGAGGDIEVPAKVGGGFFGGGYPVRVVGVAPSAAEAQKELEKLMTLASESEAEIRSIFNRALANPANHYLPSADPKSIFVDSGAQATSVTIPYGVTTIGDYAFGRSPFTFAGGCTAMTNVTLPDGLTKIGAAAFFGCTALVDVTLPKTLRIIMTTAFSGCTSLTNVTIPDGVIAIGDGAFFNCVSLSNVIIPSSVRAIGDAVFTQKLNSLTIPRRFSNVVTRIAKVDLSNVTFTD